MSTKYQAQGFSLVELLLALVIGCGLTGALLQAMLAEGSNSQRVGRLLGMGFKQAVATANY